MVFLFSCNTQGVGFALPEGNATLGQKSFIELNCNQCHSVGPIEWAGSEEAGDVLVELGGDVTKIKSYGELVTSVINPSHKIASKYRDVGSTSEGTSKMRIYNEVMTVQDLVDVVTFLQGEYNLVPPVNHTYY